MSKKSLNMKGQALVESLFTYLLLFLVSFCVIELARLQSFKTLLQISVNYYAKYIALDEMRLIKRNDLRLDSKKIMLNRSLEDKIKVLIANDLSLLETSLFSFDDETIKLLHHNVVVSIEVLANETSRSPPGVHIKAQTCLPVLFSSFLNLFSSPKTVNIGRSIQDESRERNCLGEYSKVKKNPRFWFRVRAAGYSPWPSSTQIFYKGLGLPNKFSMIDENQRTTVVQNLEKIHEK